MSLAQKSHKKKAADTILLNGNIYTGAPGVVIEGGHNGPAAGDSAKETAIIRVQAIAVSGDRIVSVGTNEEVRRLKGDRTKIIDLGGEFVVPGFNDAHLHLASGGFQELNVELAGARSLPEMLSRIAVRVREAAPGEWILGRGWDHTAWSDQRLPARQDLDAITAGHPAFLVRVDGHIAVANSAALAAAGISRSTPDPAGGKIDRDSAGEPTGIVREMALELVKGKIPPPTAAQRRRAIELVLAEAARWGITSMQDNSSWDDFLVYEELEREGNLTARITEWLPFNAPMPELQQHRARHEQTDPLLHTGMLKGFTDGSLGSRTAALLEPYADDPGNSGVPQYEPAKLNEMAAQRAAARFQIGLHAIGDRGVQMALDAFAEAEREAREKSIQPPANDGFRFRIEHAQVMAPQQFERFRQLNVIASVQPCHLLTDMNWALARLGPERARWSYAWKEFREHGVRLAFGTDYPAEPITPFRGLYAAITRKNEAGTKEYFPEQKLTLVEAIRAYTQGAAYAEMQESEKGVLLPGKLADFVVLDRDLTKVPPQEILRTRVLRTVVGGRTVFEAK